MEAILEALRINPAAADATKLARSYAARAKRYGYTRRQIKADLEAILEERQPWARYLETLADFDSGLYLGGDDLHERAKETVTRYNRLFNAVCKHLAALGYQVYNQREKGQLAAKYHGLKPKALDLITRPTDRPKYLAPMSENQVTAYYQVLCNEKHYFSGDFSAFRYYFGTTGQPEPETPPKPLIWARSVALLAYFTMRLPGKVNDNGLCAEAFRLKDGSRIKADSLRSAASKHTSGRATRGEAELKAALDLADKQAKELDTKYPDSNKQ